MWTSPARCCGYETLTHASPYTPPRLHKSQKDTGSASSLALHNTLRDTDSFKIKKKQISHHIRLLVWDEPFKIASEYGVYSTLNVLEGRMENMDMQRNMMWYAEKAERTCLPHTFSTQHSTVMHSGQRIVLQPDSFPKGPLRRHTFPKAIIIILLQQMMKENKERKTEQYVNKE